MKIHLQIPDDYEDPQHKGLLKRAALATLKHQSAAKTAELTLVLTDDEELQALNRQYRGIDAATDVLSFPLGENDPETGGHYLGDVIISTAKAAVQAQAKGHQVAEELQLLVVHGVLHLLGHDHATEGEKAAMWEAQGEILLGLGVAISPS